MSEYITDPELKAKLEGNQALNDTVRSRIAGEFPVFAGLHKLLLASDKTDSPVAKRLFTEKFERLLAKHLPEYVAELEKMGAYFTVALYKDDDETQEVDEQTRFGICSTPEVGAEAQAETGMAFYTFDQLKQLRTQQLGEGKIGLGAISILNRTKVFFNAELVDAVQEQDQPVEDGKPLGTPVQMPPPRPGSHKVIQMARIIRDIKNCQGCNLRIARRVPGEGALAPHIMFVGEAPGQQEDASGRPFVGPAGELLDSLLGIAGIQRSEVYIANTVKCRPPGNRDPLDDEAAACKGFLERQIELLDPTLIVALGTPAVRWFHPGRTVTKRRGEVAWWKSGWGKVYPVYATYHPAAGLRNSKHKRVCGADICKLPSVLHDLLSGKTKAPKEPGPGGELF